MIDSILSYLAPHLCFGCGQTGPLICESCKENIINEPSERCIVCEAQTGSYLCKVHSALLENGWYVARRAGALEQLINAYKFENAIAAHRPLGDLLLTRLPDLPSSVVVVSIPTISSHIRQRGYDHATLLAKYIAKKRQLRLASLLRRRTSTKQRDATRTERERQAEVAFAVVGGLDPSVPYLIVDDVATTGATLRHAARVLREAGAETIWVAAVARQPLD